MTTDQIRVAFAKLKDEIGPNSSIIAGLNINSINSPAFYCAIYPNMLGHKSNLFVEAENIEHLLEVARTKWEAFKSQYEDRIILKLTLDIISDTAQTGGCQRKDLLLKGYSSDCLDKHESTARAKADSWCKSMQAEKDDSDD